MQNFKDCLIQAAVWIKKGFLFQLRSSVVSNQHAIIYLADEVVVFFPPQIPFKLKLELQRENLDP